jgi:hypothetical protein
LEEYAKRLGFKPVRLDREDFLKKKGFFPVENKIASNKYGLIQQSKERLLQARCAYKHIAAVGLHELVEAAQARSERRDMRGQALF